MQQSGHLVPAVPGEIHVEEELLFQLEDLMLRVGATFFPAGFCVKPVGRRVIWGAGGNNNKNGSKAGDRTVFTPRQEKTEIGICYFL